MYAVYNYTTGATQAQVLSDLIAILTGTTNVGSLSASCVAANTSILATVPAGWSVYDAAAGTNQQVLRALNQDGSTYKYAGITLGSTTAWTFSIYESWNSGTHVGTNTCQFTGLPWSAANGGYFYIYASGKNIVISPWTATGGFGTAPCALEFSPDTVPTGYPRVALAQISSGSTSIGGSTTVGTSIPRVKNAATSGDTNRPDASIGPVSVANGSMTTTPGYAFWRDASEVQYFNLFQIGVAFMTSSNPTWLGTVYDLKFAALSSVNSLDEFAYSGITYVALKGGGGSGILWVPKA